MIEVVLHLSGEHYPFVIFMNRRIEPSDYIINGKTSAQIFHNLMISLRSKGYQILTAYDLDNWRFD